MNNNLSTWWGALIYMPVRWCHWRWLRWPGTCCSDSAPRFSCAGPTALSCSHRSRKRSRARRASRGAQSWRRRCGPWGAWFWTRRQNLRIFDSLSYRFQNIFGLFFSTRNKVHRPKSDLEPDATSNTPTVLSVDAVYMLLPPLSGELKCRSRMAPECAELMTWKLSHSPYTFQKTAMGIEELQILHCKSKFYTKKKGGKGFLGVLAYIFVCRSRPRRGCFPRDGTWRCRSLPMCQTGAWWGPPCWRCGQGRSQSVDQDECNIGRLQVSILSIFLVFYKVNSFQNVKSTSHSHSPPARLGSPSAWRAPSRWASASWKPPRGPWSPHWAKDVSRALWIAFMILILTFFRSFMGEIHATNVCWRWSGKKSAV